MHVTLGIPDANGLVAGGGGEAEGVFGIPAQLIDAAVVQLELLVESDAALQKQLVLVR